MLSFTLREIQHFPTLRRIIEMVSVKVTVI